MILWSSFRHSVHTLVLSVSVPRIELGSPVPQTGVLTTKLHRLTFSSSLPAVISHAAAAAAAEQFQYGLTVRVEHFDARWLLFK